MPFVTTSSNQRYRYLLSGFPNTGKTTSLITFIYGDNDYWSDDEHSAAIAYAASRKMVIILCPGEAGYHSLPANTEHITSYWFETSQGENNSDVKWSIAVLQQYTQLIKEVIEKIRPDVLAVDGLHNLWCHCMNRATGGDYLAGLTIGVDTNPYSAARLYSQSHTAFANYVSTLYNCPVPTIIGTVWEAWEAGSSGYPLRDAPKRGTVEANRYLWPAIPGLMAKEIVGRFDARLSCRLEAQCLYGSSCEETKARQPHHVWQFYPKGDVAGVGIKGLRRVTKAMKECPFIHQSYPALCQLIEVAK